MRAMMKIRVFRSCTNTHADRWVDSDSKRLSWRTLWLMLLLTRNPHHIQIHSGSRSLNGSAGGRRSTSRLVEPWPAGGRAELRMAPNEYHQAPFLLWRRVISFKVGFPTQTVGCFCAPPALRGALRVSCTIQEETLVAG